MVELSKTTAGMTYYLGIVLLGLGETDHGFALLEQAYTEHDGVIIYLPVDPVTDQFSADPRFLALVKKMKLVR